MRNIRASPLSTSRASTYQTGASGRGQGRLATPKARGAARRSDTGPDGVDHGRPGFRYEVQPWLAAEGRFSFVSSDPRAIDLACFASLKR